MMKKSFVLFLIFAFCSPAFAVPGYKEAMEATGVKFIKEGNKEITVYQDGSKIIKIGDDTYSYNSDGTLTGSSTSDPAKMDWKNTEIYSPKTKQPKIKFIGNEAVEYNADGTIKKIGDKYVRY